MKIILDLDGTLRIYQDRQLLLGLPPESMAKTLRRAEEPMRDYLANIGGKRNAAELAHRVMRLYYAGEAGEYEVSE